jgi:hypothetical protein
MSYEFEAPTSLAIYAQDKAVVASQFRVDVVHRYIANYENFWSIGRDEFSLEWWQSLLDTMGPVGIAILQDALKYVAGLSQSFPNDLPEKYHSAPFEYHVEAPGRIVLDSLKPAWQPQTEEEPDAS